MTINEVVPNQYRYALELQESPFSIELNPSEVHDHSSVYIYRILPLPVTVELTFQVSGLSYVEVYDADGNRFLLPEKTEINQDTTFVLDWDGEGVFEPRVWKDGFVGGISILFTLPDEQVVPEVKSELNLAPLVLATGIAIASTAIGLRVKWGGAKG